MPITHRRTRTSPLAALAFAGAVLLAAPVRPAAGQEAFTFEQVRSYPYPAQLTASATGARIAWTLNEEGRRNVFVAEGASFTPRQLTRYMRDDAQELTSVSLSPDGRWVVYVRGGDFGSNWDDDAPVNPAGDPTPVTVKIWAVPFTGGEPKALGEGTDPVIAPTGDRVVFQRGGQLWVVPIDGSAEARRLFTARGSNGGAVFSPDGSRLAFTSGRGDHSFVGIYTNDSTPIRWIDPSIARDGSPRWSPDGRRIAFVRRPATGGAPDSLLVRRHVPWSIWTADAATGEARELWKAPETLAGSVPTTHGGTNLHYVAGGRVLFLSYHDGWPHLYSMNDTGARPGANTGGEPLLLTPGRYMVEHVSLSPDRRTVVFAGNTGPRADDIDRRHVVMVPVDRAEPRVMTPGEGIEWSPVITGDGATLAFLGGGATRPPLPKVMPVKGGEARELGADRIPAGFPTAKLVTPRSVTFKAADGVTVYGQIFEPVGRAQGKRPAVVYVHGGPPRQMLLGWHYSDYYANAYALNQYLASRGFVVLAVNYRLGIGYGHDFHRPPDAGTQGAAEYRDVKAAGEYLRSLPSVDGARIGIYGGSYGGYLTALALGRDSDLFAAGVDWHGVHDWTSDDGRRLGVGQWTYEPTDRDSAIALAWRSSPVASVSTWKSPVLFIHGDDDRNVRFSETVGLARRLDAAGVEYESIVVPDDTHHWMLHRNALLVARATAEFLERKLGME
ncbi:MAG TPA: prolyl oligopeptidase family serine peptidase [Gemmatimonadaceae bacterium]|nr:prolyl oligopeptidase family serine peptidase [Gemmatimonadaceae bacterium]